MVGEYCNYMRCFDYPFSRSVWSCVLDKPVFFAMRSLTHLVHKSICRLYDDIDAEGPQFRKHRVYGLHLLTGFRMRTYMWRRCADILMI